MPRIVEYPTVVQQAMEVFGDLFANEPERQHFAEYLTGLMIAERKTVSGINREFVDATDPSCLNRWLTEGEWDVKRLNDRRLQWLQRDPSPRYSSRGVIAIDNTLIDHEGKLIEDVGWLWDHADQRYVIAHDYVISNYVCPAGAHYPIEWRRFRKREACAPGEFQDQTQLCIQLIDDVIKREIPGDFTFDSYFTSAEVLNHIEAKERASVGDLKLNRKVASLGIEQKLSEVAAQIPPEAKKPITVGEKTDWDFSRRRRIPDSKSGFSRACRLPLPQHAPRQRAGRCLALPDDAAVDHDEVDPGREGVRVGEGRVVCDGGGVVDDDVGE